MKMVYAREKMRLWDIYFIPFGNVDNDGRIISPLASSVKYVAWIYPRRYDMVIIKRDHGDVFTIIFFISYKHILILLCNNYSSSGISHFIPSLGACRNFDR